MNHYKEFVDLTVPHKEMNVFLKGEIDSVLANPQHVFNDSSYLYEKRPLLTSSDPFLINFVLYDLMLAEQYLIPIDIITNKEKLWHWLSVFVANYSISNVRHKLTDELYDNPNYVMDIEKSSSLFDFTDYLIYAIDFADRPSIGAVKKTDFIELVTICSKIHFPIREMK